MILGLRRIVPVLERRFIFRPLKTIQQTPASFGIPFQQASISTRDGERLNAWHICPPSPRASVLYFHGNSGNLGLYAEILAGFYRRRFQVLAIDYRGYGLSSGAPTERGVYQDAESAARYLLESVAQPGRPVIFWGRSLGGPIAAYAAGKTRPHGLVLETTFSSTRSLLRDFPWQFRLFSAFSESRFDTIDNLGALNVPSLVVHGDRDLTISLREGKELFSRLDGPKEFLLVEGAGHVDIHRVDRSSYWRRIVGFVDALV